jgi:molybdopterin converting factor small subunit
MPNVTIDLPSMLSPIVNGLTTVTVQADTLGQAVRTLTESHPRLGVHVFDESGQLRQHLLCLHNDTDSRWLDSLEVPVEEGDTITLLQAVSGG